MMNIMMLVVAILGILQKTFIAHFLISRDPRNKRMLNDDPSYSLE